MSFPGEFYRTAKATIYDRPEKPAPIYVAGAGPVMAKLAGEKAQGFICTSGKDRDLYIKNSPYFKFDKVTTPVLIQYGETDGALAYSSREAFVALRRLGKTVTILGYPGEGHSVQKPENQVDFTNRALEWFDQYLKPSEEPRAAR